MTAFVSARTFHIFDAVQAQGALSYVNPRIIEKMKIALGLETEQAWRLFDDTKRFLYLCGKYPENLRPTPSLDEGWHTMLLFTREYAHFCQKFLGRFIHHSPSVPSDGHAYSPDAFERLTYLARLEFSDTLSLNWSGQSLHDHSKTCSDMADCCTGGDCSNTGNCSHCTEG